MVNEIGDDVFFLLVRLMSNKMKYPMPLTLFYENLGLKRNNVYSTRKLRAILLENGISEEHDWVGTMKMIAVNHDRLNDFLENTSQFKNFCSWRFKINKIARI